MTTMFVDRLAQAGFSRAATAIQIRTVAVCYGMCFRPDPNPLIGIGLFSAAPTGGGLRFSVAARTLAEGELPPALIDWLELNMPETTPIIGWELKKLMKRLGAIADPDRHPRVHALVHRGERRLRDLSPTVRRTIKPGSAGSLGCFCASLKDCFQQLPAEFLPPSHLTETQLLYEAADAWTSWANLHGAFDDHSHPARAALDTLEQLGGAPALIRTR